jgi:fermentation-respiration switch protein FrsA (DUF1100 family)
MADPSQTYEEVIEPVRRVDRALIGLTTQEIPDVYRERSPLTYVERVRAPVLMLVGRSDPRCPLGQAQAYIDRLQTLGVPHRVYYYDSGHRPLVKSERVRQMHVQLAFAARFLGTARPKPSNVAEDGSRRRGPTGQEAPLPDPVDEVEAASRSKQSALGWGIAHQHDIPKDEAR